MNYGKDATEKRLQAANSRSDKYRSRIFLTFIKTCCVLLHGIWNRRTPGCC